MSVREDGERNKSTKKGLGLLGVAAAIGAGAAALYYVFSQPDSSNEPQAQQHSHTMSGDNYRRRLNESCNRVINRQEQFRKRTWTLEECSICCEVMLNHQNLTKLSCSHNFHSACLMPWIADNKICPNCRANIEDVM